MTADAELEERNERLAASYERGREKNRPKAPVELHALESLARRAEEGGAWAALDFVVKCTPENLLAALAADDWDRRHPWRECFICDDGRDVPRGYRCQRCGENNGYEGNG